MTTLFTATFPGADGSAWPADLIDRLEGASTAATVQSGRGRLVADGGAYRAGIALVDLASGTVDDFDFQGSWGLDSTTQETYLNWYFRCTVNATSGSPSACYTIELDTTQDKIGLWEIDSGGSYAPVVQSVAACGLNDNVRHWFRLRVEGGHIQMWYWDDGGSPTSSPQLDYTDGSPSVTSRSPNFPAVTNTTPGILYFTMIGAALVRLSR